MKKTLRYTWVVVRNLLMIGLVLLAISKTHDSVQTVMMALLIIVYVEANMSHSLSTRIGLQVAGAFVSEFARIRKLLNESSPEIEEDNPHAIPEMLASTEAEYYINTFASGIVYLIALGAIVLSLL